MAFNLTNERQDRIDCANLRSGNNAVIIENCMEQVDS